MSSPAQLAQKIGSLLRVPDSVALTAAARRAASKANAEFGRAGVPIRATVSNTGRGARISLVQTGTFTRGFGSTGPAAFLRECVEDELPQAGEEIIQRLLAGLK
jgi:hypothetical protein